MTFVTYKKFHEQEQVHALTDIFSHHNIAFIVDEDRESLDSLYGDKLFKKQFVVKIGKTDFGKADRLLEQLAAQQLDDVDRDHYLFSFSNTELREILAKPDEWNEFDVMLARKILAQKGEALTTEAIDHLKKERIRELSKPDETNRVWIIVGYGFALMGGLLGIFIGWHLYTFKKTLPNGDVVYGHTADDRKHGSNIVIVGVLTLAFSVVMWFYNFKI